MDALLTISLFVVLTVSSAYFCLRGRPAVGKAIVAIVAGCATGATYVVASEIVHSPTPIDPRCYSMDLPRFAFQGGFGGGVVSLAVVFVDTLWRLLRLNGRSGTPRA